MIMDHGQNPVILFSLLPFWESLLKSTELLWESVRQTRGSRVAGMLKSHGNNRQWQEPERCETVV